MKLVILLALSFSFLSCKSENERVDVFSVRPADFVETSLNAKFSNNYSLKRDQGLGVMFLITDHNAKPVEIAATIGFFNLEQKTEANLLQSTIQIFFDDLIKRYHLAERVILKIHIGKVQFRETMPEK